MKVCIVTLSTILQIGKTKQNLKNLNQANKNIYKVVHNYSISCKIKISESAVIILMIVP